MHTASHYDHIKAPVALSWHRTQQAIQVTLGSKLKPKGLRVPGWDSGGIVVNKGGQDAYIGVEDIGRTA